VCGRIPNDRRSGLALRIRPLDQAATSSVYAILGRLHFATRRRRFCRAVKFVAAFKRAEKYRDDGAA
jgi:hypothetical protein